MPDILSTLQHKNGAFTFTFFKGIKSNLAFSSPCISQNKDRVTHIHEFFQLHHLTK